MPMADEAREDIRSLAGYASRIRIVVFLHRLTMVVKMRILRFGGYPKASHLEPLASQ